MAAWIDNVCFVPTAGGTTDWTYSSALTGYQSPAAAGAVNATKYKYNASSSDRTQWEIGEGTYNTSTGVLSRTTVLSNSSGTGTAPGQSGAGTKINFTVAPNVAIVALKEDMISVEEANSFTTTQQAQARSNIGAQASNGATLTAAPSDPTGTTSGTAVMMGLGVSTCRITPIYSTRLDVMIEGTVYDATTGAAVGITLRYGTGAGPANGAVPTGTAVGNSPVYENGSGTGLQLGFTKRGILTGLTPGTTYWVDVSLATNSGTAFLRGLTFTAVEI